MLIEHLYVDTVLFIALKFIKKKNKNPTQGSCSNQGNLLAQVWLDPGTLQYHQHRLSSSTGSSILQYNKCDLFGFDYILSSIVGYLLM